MPSLNLQRNSEVFFSTIDLAGGAAATAMTHSNTWKLEVLAGFALTSGAATTDITSLESGTAPDRSQARFNTAINPVDWNLQTYLRPTGVELITGFTSTNARSSSTNNCKPVADWFMWQSMITATKPASGTEERSGWETGGKLRTTTVATAAGKAATATNFSTAQENHIYFKLDNVVYQVGNATVNQATVDAGIEEIATTTWTGFGTDLKELTGATRDKAISVFGGTLNAGTTATANSNAAVVDATSKAQSYHPYGSMNVAGTISTNAFIKNRLSAIEFHHKATAAASDEKFTFPVTSLSFDYNNNISYLTPEELSNLNTPIGQFTGTRAVTGSASMYLKTGDLESAGFLRNVSQDARTSSAQTSNANLIIGGTTAPYVAFQMDAVQFEFPTLATEDVISMSVNFVAQEPTASRGDGGEVTIFAQKA